MSEQEEVQVKPYTKVENELLELICKVELSGRQYRVLLAVVRKTIGWNNDVDWITAKQLCDVMGYTGATTHINSDLKTLQKRNILIQQKKKIGINLELSDWLLSKEDKPKPVTKETETGHYATDRNQSQKKPKAVTTLTENGHKRNRNRSPQKKKETYTKETRSKNIYDRTSKIQTLENFEITKQLKAWADQENISSFVKLEDSTKKFINHYQAKGTKFKDCEPAWKNWMMQAKEYAQPDLFQPKQSDPPVGTYGKSSTVDKIKADFAHLVEKEKQAEQHRTAFH